MSFVIPVPPPAPVEVTGTEDRFPVRPMESARSILVTLSLPVSTASVNSR